MQKTAYEMRISDWSSDVCSSDLDDLDDGRLGGELLAVLAPADDFDAFVHTQRRLGVAHVMPMAGDDVRRQQHVQGLAGDLLSAIAEQRLGRAVVDGDTEALVGGDNGVRRQGQDMTEPRSEEHTSELQ